MRAASGAEPKTPRSTAGARPAASQRWRASISPSTPTAAIEKTRSAAKGEDAEAIKAALAELEQASHAFSKTLYESAGGPQAAGPTGGPPPGAAPGGGGEADSGDDDAIDAEFEVKDS